MNPHTSTNAQKRPYWYADRILKESDYLNVCTERYASFDLGDGNGFEQGNLSLEDLRSYTLQNGEPALRSGKQEGRHQSIHVKLLVSSLLFTVSGNQSGTESMSFQRTLTWAFFARFTSFATLGRNNCQ